MKRVKSALALILALLMVLSMVACGKNNNTENKSTEGSKAEESKADPEAGSGHILIGIPQKAGVTDYKNNAFTKWVEENAHVTLDFMTLPEKQEEYNATINLMIANKEKLPDLFWGVEWADAARLEMEADGYFLDQAPYWESDYFKEKWQDIAFENFTSSEIADYKVFQTNENGAWYHAGGLGNTSWVDQSNSFMWINRDWLKRLNLEMPTDFASLVTVLKAFRDQDANGNGDPNDEIPMLCSSTPSTNGSCWWDAIPWLINNWCYYQQKYLLNVTDDGKLYFAETTDAYREALKNINMLVKEGLLSSASFSLSANDYKAAICVDEKDVRVGCFSCHLTNFDATASAIYQYTYLAPFNYMPKGGPTFSRKVTVSATAEDPWACMRLIWLGLSQEGTMRFRYGEKGVDWVEEVNPLDNKPHLKIVNDIWTSTAQNSFWGNGLACLGTLKYAKGTITISPIELKDDVRTMSIADYKNYFNREYADVTDEIAAKNNPKKALKGMLTLNSEEQKVYNQYYTELWNYKCNARDEFCAGVKDPNSDADWNAYLAQMKALGEEELVKAYQSAYDRNYK